MANLWCRLWSGMPFDPKWRVIARVSGQKVSLVIAVYIVLMDGAIDANADERGRTQVNAENIAAALDEEIGPVEAVLGAMEGRVLEAERLTGWERRQPLREDGAAERAKAWRERRRTQANADERERTLEEIREEEIREESPPPAREDVPAEDPYPEGATLPAMVTNLALRTALVTDHGTRDAIRQSIEAMARLEEIPQQVAAWRLEERVKAAQDAGEKLNRFWFTDAHWRRQHPKHLAEMHRDARSEVSTSPAAKRVNANLRGLHTAAAARGYVSTPDSARPDGNGNAKPGPRSSHADVSAPVRAADG